MCLRGSAWLRAKLEATCTRQWQCKLYKSIMEILDPQAGPLLNAAYNVFSERAPDANRRFRRENFNCQKSVNSSVRLHIRKQIFNLRCWIDENFSHPQAINRSWFCRESFKQPQSVSCTAFAVSEKEEGFFLQSELEVYARMDQPLLHVNQLTCPLSSGPLCWKRHPIVLQYSRLIQMQAMPLHS